MKILIVQAQPDPASFSAAIETAFVRGAEAAGHSVDTINLVNEGFSPCFGQPDLDRYHGKAPVPDDVRDHQTRVDAADVLTLIFPIYWWSFPAILKGWIDRVFISGWAFRYEEGKVVGTAHLVGLHPREIFEHRGFERIGIITLVKNGAGNGPDRPALARDGPDGGKTPTPRDDLEMPLGTIGTDKQRNQHPARADARHQVRDVGVFPLPAHVGGSDGQIAQIDKIQLHDILPSLQPHPAPDGGAGGEKRRRDRAKGRRAPAGPK